MKTSKIKRLVPRKRARQLALSGDGGAEALRQDIEREAADTIAKMTSRGYRLVACLESGEGVFAREDNVVGLHIQLPVELYRKLDATCRERGQTKRGVVIAALESYLGAKSHS